MSSGTPTPNLNLNQFGSLDDLDFAEINRITSRIDSLLPMLTCTSTTRPTADLYDGRLIFESDTGKILRRQASDSSWQVVNDTSVDTTTFSVYTNNFVNASGIGDNPVLTKRNGMVTLRARVRQTAGFTGGVAYNIPVGFRPLVAVDSVRAFAGNGGNAPGPELIFSILTNGDVNIVRKDNATTPIWDAATWITTYITYIADTI